MLINTRWEASPYCFMERNLWRRKLRTIKVASTQTSENGGPSGTAVAVVGTPPADVSLHQSPLRKISPRGLPSPPVRRILLTIMHHVGKLGSGKRDEAWNLNPCSVLVKKRFFGCDDKTLKSLTVHWPKGGAALEPTHACLSLSDSSLSSLLVWRSLSWIKS